MQLCPLCKVQHPQVSPVENRDLYWIVCPACGKFKISPEADIAVRTAEWDDRRHLLSGATRQGSEAGEYVELLTHSLTDVASSVAPPSTPFDVLDKLLLATHSRMKDLIGGAWFPFTDYPLFVLKTHNELRAFFSQLESLGYVKFSVKDGKISSTLTLDGWKRLAELRKTTRYGNRAFVAMSFAPALEPGWTDGIRLALLETGYDPVRVDKVEHNEKICDRIIAEIRRSAFVVADFTGNRAGVYFEAGFAQGLGLPVIYCVRADEIDQVHFDTRQYNYITWETPADLKNRLANRVAATVGRAGAA